MTTLGRLIVFEGPDGVGKSSISAAVTENLRLQGEPARRLTFPGNEPGTLGRLVYEVHHHPARFDVAALTTASKQALHIAAHLDAIEHQIVPLLRTNEHVLLDRYWWSTWVYGAVGGVDKRVLRRLIDVELAQWGKIKPALVILLRRGTPIDREHHAEEWQAIRSEYDLLADRERMRYRVLIVDNNAAYEQTVGHITAKVLAAVRMEQASTSANRPRPAYQHSLHVTSISSRAGRPVVPPSLYTSMSSARPSPVYDTYWRFAAERQHIFFKRLQGWPPPWTDDAVLAHNKFTNAYRASDRVSQYLIRRVIYRDDLSASEIEVFFRTILFKLFNKIETWELLEQTLGTITYADYHFDYYDAILTAALRAGQRIYSAAYIMPPGSDAFGEGTKHRNHLRLLEHMMKTELPQRLVDVRSMQAGFELLRTYPTVGNFLAYQFITDINYSQITHFSEMEFVVPGPGARDGLRKCFFDLGGLNEPEMIRFMADRQVEEFARLGLDFPTLWGRPLQLIDCQNLLCEVDKYARVMHPEIVGLSRRNRIKQRFTPSEVPIRYWYPPKWGINKAIGNV